MLSAGFAESSNTIFEDDPNLNADSRSEIYEYESDSDIEDEVTPLAQDETSQLVQAVQDLSVQVDGTNANKALAVLEDPATMTTSMVNSVGILQNWHTSSWESDHVFQP